MHRFFLHYIVLICYKSKQYSAKKINKSKQYSAKKIGSHAVSFTFDILDPGPYNLLNNRCGARYGNSHNFYYLLRYFGTLNSFCCQHDDFLRSYISTVFDRFSNGIARYTELALICSDYFIFLHRVDGIFRCPASAVIAFGSKSIYMYFLSSFWLDIWRSLGHRITLKIPPPR